MQHPARRGMGEQRSDQIAMLVEPRGPPDNRHDSVGACQFEQVVDVLVRQAVGNSPQRHLRVELVFEQRAPAPLVLGQARRAEIVRVEGTGEHVGGDGAAQQAVVDASAGRRLDETRRVADRDDAIAERPGDRRERKHLASRDDAVRTAAGRRAPSRGNPLEKPVEVLTCVAGTHEADARKGFPAADHRDDPGESLRCDFAPEMNLDVARMPDRKLDLRRLQISIRHSHLEPALEHVARAAREHNGSCPDGITVGARNGNAVAANLDVGHPRANPDFGSLGGRFLAQRAVEQAPIDDDRLGPRRRVFDPLTGGAEKPRRRQRVQDRASRRVEFVECLSGEHAGAMHRVARHQVLLEDDNGEPTGREPRGGTEAARPASDDGDIVHL